MLFSDRLHIREGRNTFSVTFLISWNETFYERGVQERFLALRFFGRLKRMEGGRTLVE